VLKATKVDGIYSADPVTNPGATKFDALSYMEVLDRGLRVMDATAISLCMDNRMRIIVFNLLRPGNMRRAILGEAIGTTVGA
jgi:uridylate kinase